MDRGHGEFEPIGDQHPLDECQFEVLENHLHQPLADLDLTRVVEPCRVDLAEHLFGGFQDFHPHFCKPFFAELAFGRVDDRVQAEVIDGLRVGDRLETEFADLERRAALLVDLSDAAADVPDHGGVTRDHEEDQTGNPESTNE